MFLPNAPAGTRSVRSAIAEAGTLLVYFMTFGLPLLGMSVAISPII